MIPGATSVPRPAPRYSPASLVRYAPIALKLDASAERSTRAVVQRTTAADYNSCRGGTLVPPDAGGSKDPPLRQSGCGYTPAARLPNRVCSRMKASLTVPVGPLRCLAMMISATPSESDG